MEIQDRWTGKNVDLTLLIERFEKFFREKGFETKRSESSSESRILVASRHINDMHEIVNIRILGDPNDFVVGLSTSERAHSFIKFGFITSLLGGGGALLRGLKLKEALEELENEFWMYTENNVALLANSSKDAPKDLSES